MSFTENNWLICLRICSIFESFCNDRSQSLQRHDHQLIFYSYIPVARQMDRANAKARQVGLVEPFSLPFPQLDSSEYMLKQDGLVPKELPADVMSGQERVSKPTDVQTHTEPGSVLLPQVAEDLQKKYPNLMGPALTQITEEKNSQQYGYQLQVPKPSGLVLYC